MQKVRRHSFTLYVFKLNFDCL